MRMACALSPRQFLRHHSLTERMSQTSAWHATEIVRTQHHRTLMTGFQYPSYQPQRGQSHNPLIPGNSSDGFPPLCHKTASLLSSNVSSALSPVNNSSRFPSYMALSHFPDNRIITEWLRRGSPNCSIKVSIIS